MHPVLEAALGFKFGNADSFAGDKGAGPMDHGEEDDDSDDDEGAVGAGEASKPKAAAPAAKAAPAPAKPKELSEEEKAAAAVAEVMLCARRRVEVGCMRGNIPNARTVAVVLSWTSTIARGVLGFLSRLLPPRLRPSHLLPPRLMLPPPLFPP
jgi:hypothetical protein